MDLKHITKEGENSLLLMPTYSKQAKLTCLQKRVNYITPKTRHDFGSRGLYYKYFYGRKCWRIVIS
jgi:hypothetical protein